MADSSSSTAKIPLPAFLKILTSNNVPASKAMAVASKIYKTYNTPSLLGQLTDLQLKAAGVDDKEVRKLVLAALRKSGYKGKAAQASITTTSSAQSTPSAAGPSTPPGSSRAETQRPRKKRKRDDDLNEFFPDRPLDEGEMYGSLEFNEILDEEVLKTKFTVVNRAPIMMAWAFVVAERLGFQREEALSIASVYTEMNAVTKGASLGIFDETRKKGMEASQSGSQPYVDLMGRRVPLYQTASSHWRALSAGAPVAPTAAFSYMTRSLRQTAPHVIGALRLLAASYTPAELNKIGFSLYADFRPSVDGWGKHGEVRCSTILSLRKLGAKIEAGAVEGTGASVESIVKVESADRDVVVGQQAVFEPQKTEPNQKKRRGMTFEEYEATFDEDITFDNIDVNLDDLP